MRNRLHKSFLDNDFLLESDFGKTLYHDFAKNQPIMDYHNHLSPKLIEEDYQFGNISQAWLAGDHYKWRAMRTFGVDEAYITGNENDSEKFQKWAETVPYTVRNPLYHWTHLELQRYFGVTALLTAENAQQVYANTTEKLQEKGHSTSGLLRQMNVSVVCTTDDPIDNLKYHQCETKHDDGLQMFPAFRPDKSYAVEDPTAFLNYMEKLESSSNVSIDSHNDLLTALEKRMAFFHENGCRLADHGLERIEYFESGDYDIDTLFHKIKNGKALVPSEITYFKGETLKFLCKAYHKRGWVQQFHLGALRNTNSRMLRKLGPDTGYDSIGDFPQASGLARFLDYLDNTDQLAKTILYNLNPADNEVMASLVGCFNDGSAKGKMQFGSGWWYLDQIEGMEKQLNTLSNIGLLSCFVGMLTDSRSFLSFPRHEYFRRILCNLIGKDVEKGQLPADEKWFGKIVSDICYNNAKNYFNFT